MRYPNTRLLNKYHMFIITISIYSILCYETETGSSRLWVCFLCLGGVGSSPAVLVKSQLRVFFSVPNSLGYWKMILSGGNFCSLSQYTLTTLCLRQSVLKSQNWIPEAFLNLFLLPVFKKLTSTRLSIKKV